MRRAGYLVAKSGPLVVLLAAVLASSVAAGDEGMEARPAVVLELFTSQGCSSCPPADRVLSRLGREAAAAGVALVPLAFHVDYWNRLGWIDPFSSAQWSARLRQYAAVFGLRSVYTPQIVLNGREELVGSREGSVRERIAGVAPPPAAGRIAILGARLEDRGSELVVDLEAERSTGASPAVANLAVFENGLVTRVESGENARRTLENDYVVRVLRPAIVIEPREAARRERLRIGLDPAWAVESLGLAAFLQDTETLEIHAAAVLRDL